MIELGNPGPIGDRSWEEYSPQLDQYRQNIMDSSGLTEDEVHMAGPVVMEKILTAGSPEEVRIAAEGFRNQLRQRQSQRTTPKPADASHPHER